MYGFVNSIRLVISYNHLIPFFHTSDDVISVDNGTFSWGENQPVLKKWVYD